MLNCNKLYTCECGKNFTNSQAFNGHKSHCKIHWLNKYNNIDSLIECDKIRTSKAREVKILNDKNKRENEINKKQLEWESETHYCEKCGKELPKNLKDVFGSGRFCSRSCANSHIQTDEINTKRSNTIKVKNLNKPKKIYYCADCGTIINYGKKYCDNCSSIRKHNKNVKAGLASSKVQSETRRSKNEIYFCELCEKYFKEVRHNEQIFNGWDADIIIEDIKYAILWNGKWHYDKITKNHSVKQVQNRDKIKIKEIENSGYTPYIIKDMGKYNKKFVEFEFNKFIDLTSGL